MDYQFTEFDSVDKQSWLSKIEADAKGRSIADFDWQINDTITQSPFIHPEDSTGKQASIQRGLDSNHWNIGVQVIVKDFEQSNKEIITALESGANELHIKIDGSVSRSDFDVLFKDVNCTYIQIYFEIKDEIQGKAIIENLIRYCKQQDQDLSKVAGGIYQLGATSFESSRLFSAFKNSLPSFSFACVSTDILFGYKETVVHEVASLLIGMVAILESETDYSSVFVNINVGKSYLLNISKIRAIHILINNLIKAYQSDMIVKVNAQLSDQSITVEENHNLIQFTSQAMSAAIGGVAGLVLPASDVKLDSGGTDFRSRLSRNIQSIMQLESFIDKVVDPAAGSYYIEKLTAEIAEQSWTYIQNNS